MGLVARTAKAQDAVPLLLQQMASGDRSVPYATGVVHVESDDEPGQVRHLRFEQGRLVDDTVDDQPADWALVRPGPVRAPFSGELARPADLQGWAVRLGDLRTPLPPLDDVASDALAHLRPVPDADLALRFRIVGSPAGMVLLELPYLSGQRVAARLVEEFGERVDPVPDGAADSTCDLTWRNYLRVRAGTLDPLESGAQGTVEGHWTHLLLLHGLLQMPEHVAAWSSLPELPEELGWFGEVAPWAVAGDGQ
ncbi:MAG: hypothetical protein ACKO04_08705 [Actinomycetes bacterium]